MTVSFSLEKCLSNTDKNSDTSMLVSMPSGDYFCFTLIEVKNKRKLEGWGREQQDYRCR